MKKHIVITGKVQNVGYRYWLYKEAIEKNISGWVRNKISGEVEALVIGNDADINNLINLFISASLPTSSASTSPEILFLTQPSIFLCIAALCNQYLKPTP